MIQNLSENLEEFDLFFSNMQSKTLVSKDRCHVIYLEGKKVITLDGDIAEVGVYKGGTSKLLAQIFRKSGKNLHLFDTFTGLPKPKLGIDSHIEGYLSDTSLEEVREYLKEFSNISYYKGMFQDTSKEIETSLFALVHVDVDLYESALSCCSFFYPRMIYNGVMLFDDYAYKDCGGVKLALDSYFSTKKDELAVIVKPQCIVKIKTSLEERR